MNRQICLAVNPMRQPYIHCGLPLGHFGNHGYHDKDGSVEWTDRTEIRGYGVGILDTESIELQEPRAMSENDELYNVAFPDPASQRTLVTTVTGCSACGETHVELTFTKLKNNRGEYTHWAKCPTSGDPVFLKTAKDLPPKADHDNPAP